MNTQSAAALAENIRRTLDLYIGHKPTFDSLCDDLNALRDLATNAATQRMGEAVPAGILHVEHPKGERMEQRRYEPIQMLPPGEHKLYLATPPSATLQAVEPAPREPMYLVMAGGDGFTSTIVPESKLDEAYLLTQWFDLDCVKPDDRADALAHFHDDDNWTHVDVTGNGERLQFSLSLEDGWVEVIRLFDTSPFATPPAPPAPASPAATLQPCNPATPLVHRRTGELTCPPPHPRAD